MNLWMFERSRLLDGDTPAELIRDGRYKDVLAVIAEGTPRLIATGNLTR